MCTAFRLFFTGALCVGAMTPLGCSSSEVTTNGSAASHSRGDRPVTVRTQRVTRGSIQVRLDLVGEVQARRSVDVAAAIPGKVLDVFVEMGEEVTKGQSLVRLDSTQLAAKLAEARAAWTVSRAAIQRAEAEHRSAASDYSRKAPLAEEDLVTPREMDQLRAKRDAAQAGLEVARAQALQAGAAVKVLQQQLTDTRLFAPFEGRVQARLLDPGAVVTAGTPILKLVHTNPAVVEFQVSEQQVGRLRARELQRETLGKTKVMLNLPAYPGKRWTGWLARLSPALDPESRSALAEAEFENLQSELMPGMYCRVEIELGGRDNVLLVPLKALIGRAGEDVRSLGSSSDGPDEQRNIAVFVVQDGHARRQAIELGAEQGLVGEVLDGLNEGDLVIVEGQSSLRDGRTVRLATEDASKQSTSAPPDSGVGSPP